VGPAILIPLASDDLLGSGHFGIGPTGVAVAEVGPWTYGALANHIWTLGTEDDPENDLSNTFIQPFAGYHFGQGTSFIVNTETTYDWIDDQWTVPVNLQLAQVFELGGQKMSGTIGARYFFDKPDDGANWGIRAVLTFVFPKT
jgi:hypothetical protein